MRECYTLGLLGLFLGYCCYGIVTVINKIITTFGRCRLIFAKLRKICVILFIIFCLKLDCLFFSYVLESVLYLEINLASFDYVAGLFFFAKYYSPKKHSKLTQIHVFFPRKLTRKKVTKKTFVSL